MVVTKSNPPHSEELRGVEARLKVEGREADRLSDFEAQHLVSACSRTLLELHHE
jgi:hypothetical protein